MQLSGTVNDAIISTADSVRNVLCAPVASSAMAQASKVLRHMLLLAYRARVELRVESSEARRPERLET